MSPKQVFGLLTVIIGILVLIAPVVGVPVAILAGLGLIVAGVAILFPPS